MTRYATVTDREVEPKVKGAAAGAGAGAAVASFIDYLIALAFFHSNVAAVPWQITGVVALGVPAAGAWLGGYLSKHVNRSQPAKPLGDVPPPLTVGHLTASTITADLIVGPVDGPKHAAPDAPAESDYPTQEWQLEDPHGIHAHPTKKLGALPPDPNRAAVPFGQFVKVVPAHPIVDAAPQLTYPMYRNNVAGDCVVAGLAHALQVICALLGVPWVNWTDAEVLAFYRTQNPDFRSWADAETAADGGMIIQKFLEYLVSIGKILAFGKINHANEEEMKAATYLGLAIVTGETLEAAQQSQAVWDYQPSGTWGGHCTTSVGYQASPDRQTVVTWGALVDVTQAFIAHQLTEAWFVLTQAHIDHPAFRAGFDLAGFAAAVAELTGGKVVVPVPAPQPPPPGPAPAPGPGTVPADWVAKAQHILRLKSESPAAKALAHEVLAAAGVS